MLFVAIVLTRQRERSRLGKAPLSPLVLNWPFFIFIAVMPNLMPDALTSWFYPLAGVDERSIRQQAQGMVFLGMMVITAFSLVVQKFFVARTVTQCLEKQPMADH